MASDAQLTTDVLLGDVATFRSGSVFKPDEQGQRSGDIPFIKVSDLNLPSNSHKIEESNNWLTLQSAKRLGTTIHPAGATVFAKIGVALTYNRRRLLIRDTAIDNNLMSAIPNPSKIRPEFLYHTLRCLDFNEIAKGSALPYINIGDLKGLRVRLPSLPEQEEICSLLDALDDRIDLLRQTNATLEAIAQALFKSWFVDFDPVRAKAEGREPEGMDPATAAIFPSEFEESELGLIPKGWQIDEIGKVGACVGGATPSTKEPRFWDDPVHHWVTPKDLSGLQSPVLIDTERKVSEAGLAKISSGLLPIGTLLLSSRAPIGYLAIAHVPTAINQGFIAMLPGGQLPASYLLFWTKLNMDAIKQKANGSTFMEISKSAFRPIRLVVPPPQVITEFDSICKPMLDRIAENEKKRRHLGGIRDTLLPRLISGKLRLPQAEAVEEAPA